MKRFVLVTLFDSNYLAKGLVNYYSLQKYLKNFVLYAYCFDELSYEAISKLNLKNLVAIRFSDFEDKMLLKIKGNKDRLYEYYWACVPFVIEKTLQRKEAEYVTYMDADLMFFSNPSTLFDFSKDVDVLIQPNNFSYNETHQFDPVGYYCSGWVTFRDNPGGRRVLEWWNRQCLKWCSAKQDRKVTKIKTKLGTKKVLKPDYVLNADTGKVYRKPTREEAEKGQLVFDWTTMPKFVRDAWGK